MAEHLNIPQVTYVEKVEVHDDELEVKNHWKMDMK